MSNMLGTRAWFGNFCTCCGSPRPKQNEKRREEAAWRKEVKIERAQAD